MFFLFILPCFSSGALLEVDTPYGPVTGSSRTTATNTSYFSFQGIPFAKPPTGSLRLLAPEPPTPWSSPLDVSGDSRVMCPQLSETVSGDLLGQEDCLYLNIYTPAMETASLPVMVWLYGGGFITGSGAVSEYGPDRWLDQGIVVVTLNYRGYALGFLSLGTSSVPGNQGLLDQLLALRFVQETISSFGGDPGSVTLMGQSAGSSSALYHLMSPRSAGLFHRVIAQSGSNFSPSLHSITGAEAARFGVEASIAMGCLLGGERRLQCLQGLSFEKFVRLNQAIGVNLKPNEDIDYADDPFMPMSPMEALRSGNYLTGIPVIIGTNEDDGLILTTPLKTDPSLYLLYRNLWSVIAPGILFHIPVEESSLEASRKASELADFYLGGSSHIVPENFDIITDMFTDAFVTYAVECFVSYAHQTQPVFQYRYVHQGDHGLNTDDGLPKYGVNHGDELYLQWDPVFGLHHPLSQEDTTMSSIIVKAWSSFIKTGVPDMGEVDWVPATTTSREYMVLDINYTMSRSQDYQEKMDFWKELFPC